MSTMDHFLNHHFLLCARKHTFSKKISISPKCQKRTLPKLIWVGTIRFRAAWPAKSKRARSSHHWRLEEPPGQRFARTLVSDASL
jgi:hypothetical protein